MKATDLVVTQHREVKQLFEQLETAGQSGDTKAVREELAQNLVAHAVMEEEILYPAMKQAIREEIAQSFVEHGMMAYALAQVLATRPADESYRGKVHVLETLVMHHMHEEESEVLPRAESALGSERLMRLGDEMEERFEQVKAKGYKAFLRRELARFEPHARAARAAAKKTAPAKAPATAKGTSARRAPQRQQPKEARQTAKRGAAPAARKNGQQRARSARAHSR